MPAPFGNATNNHWGLSWMVYISPALEMGDLYSQLTFGDYDAHATTGVGTPRSLYGAEAGSPQYQFFDVHRIQCLRKQPAVEMDS